MASTSDPSKTAAVQKKPKEGKKNKRVKKPKYKAYELEDLRDDQIVVEDVLDALNRLFGYITELDVYNVALMQHITKQLLPGGAAAEITISLDAYKVAINILAKCRLEMDYRITKFIWPLFHALYQRLPVDDVNEGIKYFYGVKSLQSQGRVTREVQSMVDSFPNYHGELASASQFILKEPLCITIDERYLAKCKRLCFCLMLHHKRAVRDLTMDAIVVKKLSTNLDVIRNLALFFHYFPALVLHEVSNGDSPEQMEPLGVALVRRIFKHERLLVQDEVNAKRDGLEEYVKELTRGLAVVEQFEGTPRRSKLVAPLFEAHQFEGLLPPPPPPFRYRADNPGQPQNARGHWNFGHHRQPFQDNYGTGYGQFRR